MKPLFVMAILLTSILFGSISLAAESPAPQSLADVKIQLIHRLQIDGYLSDKMANEVASKYVTSTDIQSIIQFQSASSVAASNVPAVRTVQWSDYMSWINFIKVTAIIFLLLAFSGLIRKFMFVFWKHIKKVPLYIYQAGFLCATVTGTLVPQLFWASQAFYVALFCSFANLIILGWIIYFYPKAKELLLKLLNVGLPEASVASFWAMVYFGALAFAHHSALFGFFAAVGLSGIFSFGLYYSPGVLTLYFKRDMLNAITTGHLIVLGAYSVAHINGIFPEILQYFNAGLQYYCSIALGLALLIGSAPFYRYGNSAPLFIGVVAMASMGYFFWDLKVIASILFCFFALFIIEWVGYWGYRKGFITGTAALGALLYGCSLLLEQAGTLIILKLN